MNDSRKVDEAANRLASAVEGDRELLDDIAVLKKNAESGLTLKRWSHRFLFGFGLAKSIEDWFDEFDSRSNLPLQERIPRDATSKVAAKWAWFSVFTSLAGTLAGLSVAILTLVFLTKQIKVLTDGNEVARLANEDSQKLLAIQIEELSESNELTRQAFEDSATTTYITHLYENDCDITTSECKPTYGSRIRQTSAESYLNLQRRKGVRPNFRSVYFDRSNISGLDFENADLSDAHMNSAVIGSAVFSGARLAGASLEKAVGIGAIFNKANLGAVNAHKSHLTDADFTEACILQANFSSADLRRSNFTNALLTHSRFMNTDLKDAVFKGSILTDVNFTDAKGLEEAQFSEACGDKRTKFPAGWSIAICDEPQIQIESCKLPSKK